jgi:Rrf2 family protein
MNISVKSDYALLAIFDLALNSGDPALNGGNTPVKIADIATRQRIPQKFLELILSGLKQGGFVESRRGAEGGYLLARPAENLSVGEVLRFVEGRQETRSQKRRQSDSPFGPMWARVDRAIDGVVESTNFAQLVREWKDRHNKFIPNWEI